MVEDTRLFSANNPIGRIWYFINLFFLAVLTKGIHYGIESYVIPNANEAYDGPIKLISWFIYLILAVTFFMLLDRRLFDIIGKRDSFVYNSITKILCICVLVSVTILVLFHTVKAMNTSVTSILNNTLYVIAGLLAIYTFLLGLLPGNSVKSE